MNISLKYKLICLFLVLNSTLYAESPQLVYSTLIGGSGWDYGHAITVDDSGYVYIAGQANSTNYPTTAGVFDRTHNGGADVLVTKINRGGSALVYSTLIGGSVFDDTRKVFIDKSGCVYLTGSTQSASFPTTTNSLAGSSQGYFLKLDPNGKNLDYSSRWAGGDKILVDSEGYVIILGSTNSAAFPTTENAYCRTLTGGDDLFVAKIDLTNNSIVFSTLIGGSGDEWAPGMQLDSHNNIIIAGQTASVDYPVTTAPLSGSSANKKNVFVTKLKADGSQLVYSTMIGGSEDEWPFDVAVDMYNNAYVTGVTLSNDFPVSASAVAKSASGNQDAFLFKLDADGKALVYSTYLGGAEKDGGRGVVVDKSGKAYITGCTKSTNFPVTADAYDKSFNGAGTEQWAWGDPFLLVMNAEGSNIEYCTYIGGSADEEAYGIAMDQQGGVYLCGVTSSANFPATPGAFDRSLSGGCNCYVAKFQFSSAQPAIDYLGQTPPDDAPVIFAPGIVSVNGRYEYGLSVAPDGNEIFFTADSPGDGLTVIKRTDGQWGVPVTANLRGNNSWEFEAFFTANGNKLYFTSDTSNLSKFWCAEKNINGWGKSEYLDSPVNNTSVMWCTFTVDETMYYGNNSDFKIHRAGLVDGNYSDIENLGFNGTHPSVSPDESFFLFNSSQYGGQGKNDILVVFKQEDGSWSSPINLGDKINTGYGETCASLSPDGKYIFFSRYNEPGEKSNIYWVSSAVIDSLKKNFTRIEINETRLPDGIHLQQNYPNPFNPTTAISYQLADNSIVKLQIYDVLGQEIKTLVDSYQGTGEHAIVWNGTDDADNPVSSGIYFYSLETEKFKIHKKLVLVR
ncbi:MAG TPA: SBBP repeat-containing protein [bacterium]|nr:SBBP repeat-containing protein [bacterium]HPN43513.1 SBBP repeat-containing protein [bacterium]